MTTVTISLPESLRDFVDNQVKKRGFGNVSEYFRTLIRDAQERESEKRLHELLLEGLESGEGREASPELWSEVRSDVAERVLAHKKRNGRA